MKKSYFYSSIAFVILNLYCITSLAWDHSVELGYGYSHDPNHSQYENSGFMLSGDIIPVWRSPWTFFTVTGSLGQWHSSTSHDRNLTTAAVSLALRLYPITSQDPIYLLASFGPAYLSSRKFGENTQAKHLTIQSNIGLGKEFNCMDINLRLAHYSNASLAQPNDGFNILYFLSIGYLF